MAVGLTLGLTLASLGLSAYSSKAQAKANERTAKTQKMLGDLNKTKYQIDLESQRGQMLTEAKMAISEVQRNDANRNAGTNTASQALVQGIMGELEASEQNIKKNVKDAEFSNKMAGLNADMGLANAKMQSSLSFLGQAFNAGAGLYAEHKADVRAKTTQEGLESAIKENRSAIQSIMDNMKF